MWKATMVMQVYTAGLKKTHRWWNQLMNIGTCIIWHCIENVIFIYSENLNSYHELCPKTYFHFKFESRQ